MRDAAQELLNAPYGHYVKRLPDGSSKVTLLGVPGGNITREAPTFSEAVFAALDAAREARNNG